METSTALSGEVCTLHPPPSYKKNRNLKLALSPLCNSALYYSVEYTFLLILHPEMPFINSLAKFLMAAPENEKQNFP